MPVFQSIKTTGLVTNRITSKRASINSSAVFLRYGRVFIENDPFMNYFN